MSFGATESIPIGVCSWLLYYDLIHGGGMLNRSGTDQVTDARQRELEWRNELDNPIDKVGQYEIMRLLTSALSGFHITTNQTIGMLLSGDIFAQERYIGSKHV